MKNNDSLFLLIRSMSQSERRYFSRFAKLQTASGVNRYLALFLRICRTDEWDAEALKKEFGEKYFPQLRQQLYRKLLQSLRLYHESTDTAGKLAIGLKNFRVLDERGLTEQAEAELQKSLLLAERNGLFAEWNQLRREQIRTLLRSGGLRETQALLRSQQTTVRKINALAENENTYNEILIEAEIINRRFEASRSTEDLKIIDRFLAQPLLSDEKTATTPRARLIFYFTKGLISYLRCHYSATAMLMHKAVKLSEAFPFLQQSEPLICIRALANRTLALFQAGPPDKFKTSLQILRRAERTFPAHKNYLDELIRVLELMHLNREQRYTEALSRIRRNRPALRKNYVSQQEIYYVFQTVMAYRGARDFKKASAMLLEFIKSRGAGIKKDAFSMARILFLLIRFEMEDEGLLQSELHSVKRYLKKENLLGRFENRMLTFISAMQTASTAAARKKEFRKLAADLQELKKNPLEQNAFRYFDAEWWLGRYL